MTRDEIRMKLWCDVFSRIQATSPHSTIGDIEDAANSALEMFDQRFPAESSEPVDEPREVWVTFPAGCLDGQAWNSERSAKQIIEDYANTCYAEFQQVGPMVRRDDGQPY